MGDPGYAAARQRQFDLEDLAVNILWGLSGRQFGVCQTTIRPCADERQPIHSLERMSAYVGWRSWGILEGGIGLGNLLGCGCGAGRCLISGPSAVHLPGPVYPPDQDHSVTVTFGHSDGPEVLDPSEYVIEGDKLIRRHGRPWPFQNHTRPLGEAGTWSVQYWRGTPPPRGAGLYVGILTKELLAAVSGGQCRIPRSVSHMSRQGVSYDFDMAAIFASGRTGVPEIDTWLKTVNPHALMQPPRVL